METITRRALLGSLAAVPAVAAVAHGRAPDQVVTVSFADVAHAGKNLNGRDYAEVLEAMGKAAAGKLIVSNGALRPASLDEVWGIVHESWIKRSPDFLPISNPEPVVLRLDITWFREPPIGAYVAPNGKGVVDKNGMVHCYILEDFELCEESYFQRAAPVALRRYQFRSDVELPEWLKSYRLRACPTPSNGVSYRA